ncbi:hypothetical protein BT63DRAFT_272050 [Microthyrium microscopicum]|uniref:Secreted protein n=1 Tax=Microthyrium microscopicum TaxID=703497 RepID=A0A6A6UAU4_9PEZI|nr:hypothetical protein BT63DRAFT_272050 [Microthyrium microscopicum]
MQRLSLVLCSVLGTPSALQLYSTIVWPDAIFASEPSIQPNLIMHKPSVHQLNPAMGCRSSIGHCSHGQCQDYCAKQAEYFVPGEDRFKLL